MKTTPETMTDTELFMIYEGLCVLAVSPEGMGHFHNADPRAGVYRSGARGRVGIDEYADSPTKNRLFVLGHSLHNEACKRSLHFFEGKAPGSFGAIFSSWENFCEAVVEANDKRFKE